MKQIFLNYLTVKGYSENTYRNYEAIYDSIIKIDKDIFNKGQDEIIAFLCEKIRVNKISQSYVSQFVSVFNIVVKEVLKTNINIRIPRSKRPIKQPDILSTEEMTLILNHITNVKHKTIVALMYSTGLRVSEACNLKIIDIDTTNNFISVRKAKGGIDRKVMLDQSMLEYLRKYYVEYKPNEYLFNGAKGNEYSSRSVQQIITKAAKSVGIKKRISSHSMRHSCFTQLIRNGVDIRTIQRLAGHKDISTTARYLQISDNDVLSIVSPISLIQLNGII